MSAAPGFLALFVCLVVLFSVFCVWVDESSVRIWNNSEMLLSHQWHFLSYHRQVPLKILQKRYVTGFYFILKGELQLEIYVELTEEFSERLEGWQLFYIHLISEILPFFKKWRKRWHNLPKHWFVGLFTEDWETSESTENSTRVKYIRERRFFARQFYRSFYCLRARSPKSPLIFLVRERFSFLFVSWLF